MFQNTHCDKSADTLRLAQAAALLLEMVIRFGQLWWIILINAVNVPRYPSRKPKNLRNVLEIGSVQQLCRALHPAAEAPEIHILARFSPN